MIYERHRHRYELNNSLRERLEAAGLVCRGTWPDDRLVEITELADHPFMVGKQFHPEFKKQAHRSPHPLFRDLVAAALERARERAPDGEVSASRVATLGRDRHAAASSRP